MAYDRDISKLLIQAVSLACQQYNRWESDRSYNGDLKEFDLFNHVFHKYEQLTNFQSYFPSKGDMIYQHGDKDNQENTNNTPLYFPYVGFLLKSKTNHIIAFRGALTQLEQYAAMDFMQVPYVLGGESYGNIYSGISKMYIDIHSTDKDKPLRDQIYPWVEKLDPNIPCYLVGHSFGGPYAILTALELILTYKISANNVFMYNYGATAVGDPVFAEIYDTNVPNSYRVVNTTDYAQNNPPQSITLGLHTYHYKHVGEEWSFTIDNDPPPFNNHMDIDYTQEEPQLDPYYTAIIREWERKNHW